MKRWWETHLQPTVPNIHFSRVQIRIYKRALNVVYKKYLQALRVATSETRLLVDGEKEKRASACESNNRTCDVRMAYIIPLSICRSEFVLPVPFWSLKFFVFMG